jgi:signal peptidase I
MFPTLHVNQRVLVNRIGTHFSSPHVGDIVVFHPPRGADPQPAVCGSGGQGGENGQACDTPTSGESQQTFIKRVVGVPGDRISIVNGHVIRNGVAEKDSYIVPCDAGGSCTYARAITVPRGQYYMMGDNRPDSDDSRFWGPVRRSWIIGKAFLTYWPPGRIGFL